MSSSIWIFNNFNLPEGIVYIVVVKFGNVDPLYCPSVLLPIRYNAHPTYDSCLFLYYLRVRLGYDKGKFLGHCCG